MNDEFLDHFNRELALLREQAAEFAAEYPGVAERLGGIVGDRSDPMIAGLIDATAFLAARVQLKLKHEFLEFTSNLLEQLVPQFLSPTPSVVLARVTPPFADPGLRAGRTLPRGAYIDAGYVERERKVACRFRLTADLALWPIDLVEAEYHNSASQLRAMGIANEAGANAGLRLSLLLRTAEELIDEAPPAAAFEKPDLQLAALRTDELTFHLLGTEAESAQLYEQIFGHRVATYFRYVDAKGRPVVVRAPEDMVQQIGFSAEESLLPNDTRLFAGFDLAREYFVFPAKFLGFRLIGLQRLLPLIRAKSVEVIVVFDDIVAKMSATVRPQAFSMYTAPAINLFEKTLDRVIVSPSQHEFHLVPDRSRPLQFETNKILDVSAHFAGQTTRVPVAPLYSTSLSRQAIQSPLVYTARRQPRRRPSDEDSRALSADYRGTEMFIALGRTTADGAMPSELTVRALCTNRHLPAELPVGTSGADFRLIDDASLPIQCVAGPSPPGAPVVAPLRTKTEEAMTGEVAWRLIGLLTLNHIGLVDRGAGKSGGSLRELLAVLASGTAGASPRRIQGIQKLDARPVVRRVKVGTSVSAARGLEITVLLDDKAFEGSSAFLLGAVLERLFAEYVALNHFTETVIRTNERGEIKRWPARSGSRSIL